jgi:hypothetical protein
MITSLAAMSQIFKPPSQLVKAETSLVFAPSMQPDEACTDDDPPAWADREEQWSIDELLGRYDLQIQKITIYNKGIEYVAGKLDVLEDWVKLIVRIHEWGHAVFHVGVDEEKSNELAKASLANDGSARKRTLDELTTNYDSVDPYVHEQFAQAVTWLSLETLRGDATVEEAKKASASIIEVFQRLTKRQPTQYRLDQLQRLKSDQLRTRLRAMIGLIRNKDVRGNQTVWDKIMLW